MKSKIQHNIAKVTMPLALVAPLAYAQNTTAENVAEKKTEANLGVTTVIENTSTEIDGITALAVEVDSEIRGVEAQLQGRVTDNWSISAGYSYLDGETTTGVRPRELPEHMFSVWNTFKVTDKLSFGLGAIYQSDSLISSGGSASLPSYFRVDAAAYYQLKEDVRLQLNIENLLDTTYYPNAHSTHQATVGSPISARFGVEFKF